MIFRPASGWAMAAARPYCIELQTVWVGHSCPTLLTLTVVNSTKFIKCKGVGQECPTHVRKFCLLFFASSQ